MPDVRLDVSFLHHPKIKKLQRRLGTAGPLALIRLWLFAAQETDRSGNGALTNLSDEDIAIAADYDGDHQEFVRTLSELRLLDGDEYQRVVHNWTNRQTYLGEQAKRADRARKAARARWSDDAERHATSNAKSGSSIAPSMRKHCSEHAQALLNDAHASTSNAPDPTRPDPTRIKLICAAPAPPPKRQTNVRQTKKGERPASKDSKRAGPKTAGGRIVDAYKQAMGLDSYDGRASYKLVRALTDQGLSEQDIANVVAYAVANPRALPDGSKLQDLGAILSAGWFPHEQARYKQAQTKAAPIPKPDAPRRETEAETMTRLEKSRAMAGVLPVAFGGAEEKFNRTHGWGGDSDMRLDLYVRAYRLAYERRKADGLSLDTDSIQKTLRAPKESISMPTTRGTVTADKQSAGGAQ